LVSALVWGTRGRRFKSGRPDHMPAAPHCPLTTGGIQVAMNRAVERPSGGRSRRVLTIPNILSLLRLASVPVSVWLFVTEREEAGLILYGVGAGSDFFDGYIARRTGSVTELGKLLDPLADRILILALAISLVVTDALPLWLAATVIARDVIVLVAWPALERRGLARIPVNFTGKCATAALLAGLGWLAWSQTSWPLRNVAGAIGMTLTVLGAVLYWAAAVLYVGAVRRRQTIVSGAGDTQRDA
jgi:cardiolipin synthase (CMP-forming)